MAGARAIVSGPSFNALPYGLWDVAQKPTPENSHWQLGITWEERCNAGATTYEECITVTGTGGETVAAPASKSDNVDQLFRGATPFTVFTEYTCSPVGRTVEETNALAEAALLKVEDWWISRAFATGVSGGASTVWPHLSATTALTDPQNITLQTAATQLVTGGGDIAHVLGELEAGLADCYHGQGVIHVAPEALPTLRAWDLVKDDGNGILHTTAGNIVVVGTGYTGASPAGAAASTGTSWIYATGAVFGYRSAIRAPDVPMSFNRAENTVHMLAERTYVLAFECCHLAALATLGVPT
jgi:hypothetical protein